LIRQLLDFEIRSAGEDEACVFQRQPILQVAEF
jgi:hypothetical protein